MKNFLIAVLLILIGASYAEALYGVALHDVYHAGQIRLLRRLGQGARD